jgi:hypothetical protein
LFSNKIIFKIKIKIKKINKNFMNFLMAAIGHHTGPWVSHVQGVEKVSDHGTKHLDKRRNLEGNL